MNIALLLSGGTGSRIGGEVPKQYIEIAGRPVIAYTLERLASCPELDALWIVAAEEWRGRVEEILRGAGIRRGAEHAGGILFRGFSEPGGTRQLSILNALRDIAEYAAPEDIVLIHDAARPEVSPELLGDCILAARERGGALPVLPMKDTVYLSGDGSRVTGLLDRKQIYAGQAPEAFRLGEYLAANEALHPDRIREINGSAEPAVLAGMDIALLPGEESNFKITTPEDLERFRELAGRRSSCRNPEKPI